ncbi:hypothetical protein [Paenibacillus sp. GP183]|jgi:hypothetical protein|uniref:hypothetical protein n=1 Tax=Paenibacillus sp. GP183 TaxID=1882751 RepID=UPI00089D7BB7|nr:hypothetical protein [Paenibacillus sp. GP183]SEB75177.1 hypothetical protein SAMN05443246_1792 [Paenibacillus sp. GP183]
MDTNDKSGKQREITYQIGWKKGKIQLQAQSDRVESDESSKLTQNILFRLHERFIWRVTPAAPESWLFPLLYLLPALVFLLTFVLVYQLSHQ